MAVPSFTIRQLLEAGVHFGHAARRWNPKMKDYIYGERNKIHIINLEKTAPLLHEALILVREVAAQGGRVLFVGTKRQAAEKIAESAESCGQYYVNHRWLGGMLTNWKTISQSIRRLKSLENLSDEKKAGLTKKEILQLDRERTKLSLSLGGIKNMGGIPDVILVIDTNREKTAILEANKLGVPVIGVLDTNSDPEGIDYPIPGNDDALRAISLYCDLIAEAVLDGMKEQLHKSGGDAGESEAPETEKVLSQEEGSSDDKISAASETNSAETEDATDSKAKTVAEESNPAEAIKEDNSTEETSEETAESKKAKKEAVG